MNKKLLLPIVFTILFHESVLGQIVPINLPEPRIAVNWLPK